MTSTALVLGARGRFGRSVAEAMQASGWTIRTFDRQHDRLPDAAMGADIIVNGWNPTYDKWAAELPGLTERLIGAAKASGATVIQPANVYVYGGVAPEVFAEDTPHRATNPLGRLRIEMEETLRTSGVPVIMVRAGDFIDTEGSGNWLDRIILAKLDRGRIDYPGNPDIPHAWAYLPDLARIAVALAGMRANLGRFEEVNMPGYTLTGRELAELVGKAVGRPVRLHRMSWLPLYLARPFWPMAGYLLEMRYLWDKPHRLGGARLAQLLPDFRPTPPDEAVRAAVAGLGSA